ncbi:MAG: hypothetical protein ABJA64_03040 [Candidatus Saccharibacteria bacterium]
MNTTNAFVIITVAALIHASFQLSVSVLTLLSGHAIGAKKSHAKLVRLTGGFVFGVTVMTVLLLSFVSFVLSSLFQSSIPLVVWAVACGLLLGLGVAVWSFYYRRERGTTLWLPRGLATYLSDRTKATKQSAEAFGLGLSSVIAELIFIIAPILVTSLILIQLSPSLQLAGIAIYTVISLMSLLIVASLIGSGHKLSRIQQWRETNKRFLQFAAGSGLLVLGFYLYVDQVMAVTALAYGGQ